MKILHVIPSLIKGGAERLTLDICQSIQNSGHEVKIVCFREDNEYYFLKKELDIEVLPVWVRPSLTRKWSVQLEPLTKIIKHFEPEILHSHLFEAELVTRYQGAKNIAYVTHLHDNMPQMRNFATRTLFNKRMITDWYEKQFLIRKYRICKNNFIAISKDTEKYFKSVLPRDLHRITIMPNAIRYDNFYNPKQRQLKSKLEIRLVSVGSLVDKKNQIFLIDIAIALKKLGIHTYIDVLGDGPNRKKIQNKIDELGLHSQIILHGSVNNVQQYLDKADAYIHPAWYEPFGLVLIEAMAAGLPVVCLDGKGNRDIMENGKNGFIISEENPDLFAEKIQAILLDKHSYNSMSDYARIFAQKFDMKEYATGLLSYYKDKTSAIKLL